MKFLSIGPLIGTCRQNHGSNKTNAEYNKANQAGRR